MKKYLTEFLGTFVLVFTILTFINPVFIGVTLAIIIYIGYHFSGAHYNPAVTFCIYLMKKISLKESFFYICSQLFGSLSASYLKFLVSGILISRFDNIDHNFFEIRKILTKLGITSLGISYEVFPIRKNLIRNIITWFVRFFLLGKT